MVKEHGWRSGESTVLHHGGIGRAVSTTLQCCSTKSCNYVIVSESTFLGLWAVGVFRSWIFSFSEIFWNHRLFHELLTSPSASFILGTVCVLKPHNLKVDFLHHFD